MPSESPGFSQLLLRPALIDVREWGRAGTGRSWLRGQCTLGWPPWRAGGAASASHSCRCSMPWTGSVKGT